MLTAARSAEARQASWDEIDLNAREWTVPAARTKAGREHWVPLCRRAVEILDDARRLGVERTGGAATGLVFPSQRGKTIGDARLSGVLKQLGIGAVPHGFRSSFRDWASERTDHPREEIEAALAHVVRNQTEAAYARSRPPPARPLGRRSSSPVLCCLRPRPRIERRPGTQQTFNHSRARPPA